MSESAICPTCRRPLELVRECADCGVGFTIEPAEQEWFAKRSLMPPRRCQACRQTRRQARAAVAAEEKNE